MVNNLLVEFAKRRWVPENADIGAYLTQADPLKGTQLIALLSGVHEETVFQHSALPPGTIHDGGLSGPAHIELGPKPQYSLRKALDLDQAISLANRYLSERLDALNAKKTEVQKGISEHEMSLSEMKRLMGQYPDVVWIQGSVRSNEEQLAFQIDFARRLNAQSAVFAKVDADYAVAKEPKDEPAIRAALTKILNLA